MGSIKDNFHVAIIGGGLCGISLAIALKVRNVPFTLYESRGSFTEIGAGINLGPSALRALRLIDPSLGEKVHALATRNPPPDENTWMYFRYGAASGNHQDGELIEEMKAPPTGNLSVHRQELLQVLANDMGVKHARFNKKFVGYTQSDEGVSMKFADGSVELASIVIGCDGIHSRVRTAMFGKDSIVSRPSYGFSGCYRAVLPMDKAVAAIGESARRSQVFLGPKGYLIHYPVNDGKFVNCGAWPGMASGDWDTEEWVKHNQHQEFVKDFEGWGEGVKKLLDLFPHDVSFWAMHQHIHQPEHFQDGRVLLIGDGAHAMPPHQGSGAAQAVEDAYVLAEVLAELDQNLARAGTVEAALHSVEEVRKPRFTKVHRYSSEAGSRWFDFLDLKLEGSALEEWKRVTRERLEWIWGFDMAGEAEKAKSLVHKLASHPEVVPSV
jgi:salicylate hydroxylase